MQPVNSSATELTGGTRVISRLLVVRLSAMGDVLHTLPAVAALRQALPLTRVTWVVDERWADLVRCASVRVAGAPTPVVDQVHTVNIKTWRRSLWSSRTLREIVSAIKALRTPAYQVAVDFQGAARSSLIARLSAAPSIYGFAEPRENVASMFYTTTVLPRGKHIIEQNVSLASAVAGAHLRIPHIEFGSSSPVPGFAPPASEYVILNPGAGWGAKQWPPERFGEAAKRLASQFQISSLINVGPGEETLMRAVQVASAGAAKPISCSLPQLVDVIRGARLFIGGDTGPMHLAAAMGIPVVAIFGPTDPARTGPFGTRNVVLRNRDSRTTLSHEPSPDRAMLEISTDAVVSAAARLLKEGAGE